MTARPLRRSAVVAAVATAVTTTAHTAAHGTAHLPAGRTAGAAGVAFVLLFAAQEAVGSRRPGAREIAAWLVGGQAVVHGCLLLAADARATTGHRPAAAMALAHLVAAAVHAAAVCGARQCLLVVAIALAAGAGRVRQSLRALPVPADTGTDRPSAGPATAAPARTHPALLVRGCLDRRGPPAVCAPTPTTQTSDLRPRSPPCP